MTDASQRALHLLRSPDHFQWYLIPLLAFILYVYVVEVQIKNWHVVLAGLILSAAEFTWEMLNALVLHVSQYSAVWTTPGDTAYLMMFFVAGVIVLKTLPEERTQKILGLPNRLIIPLAWGVFCAFIEVILNRWGALVWAYTWWNWPNVYLIVLGYSVPFLLITWVYDRTSISAKVYTLLFLIALNSIMWIVFVNVLEWI
jgi:hypothetical protein